MALLGNNSKISNSDNYINKDIIGYSKKLINMNDEYNGWTNFETWLIALWLDNDETLYKGIRDVKSKFGFMSDTLAQSWVMCKAVKICHGLRDDIAEHNVNMDKVNWYEIADLINDD